MKADNDTILQMDGWIARDEDGEIYLWSVKPTRCSEGGEWEIREVGVDIMLLPDKAFPNLKWEDEPRKVKITIE